MSILNLSVENRIAILSINQPGSETNRISTKMMAEFKAFLDEMEENEAIQAVILHSTKKDSFIAGADIRLFLGFHEPGDALAFSREGNMLLNRLNALSVPVIAAIHGAAHGGGLEVALACHHRIATDHPSTRLSLPEVTLGLCPAAGGSQRLPALVGVQKALPLLLSGRAVTAREAQSIGLVDELVPENGLLQAARVMAGKLAGNVSTREKILNIAKKAPLPDLPEFSDLPGVARAPFSLLGKAARTIRGGVASMQPALLQAERDLKLQTRGLYPAPEAIVACVKYGVRNGLEAGLEFESRMFEELAGTPESRELLHAFLARLSSRRNPSRKEPRPVDRIGVLGTGLMGSAIASVSLRKGFGVTVRDRDYTSAGRAKQAAWQDLQGLVERKAMLPFERDRILSELRLTDRYDDFADLPLVIEAVVEDVSVKHAVLREAESVMRSDAIFATNTSAIPISEIAKPAKYPERVIGMHYFSPAQKMPLVEIIRGKKTDEEVVATACDVAIRQGKNVIVVGDAPGFYVTRIVVPMINEAMLLISEGADVRIVDAAVKNFGFPVGPVTLTDEVGIDVVSHVFEEMNPIFKKRGGRFSQTIHRLHENGYGGRKNRRGFYDYDNQRNRRLVNSEVYAYFGGKRRRDVSVDDITERITLAMVNEALLCLQDGIIDQPRTGDIGAMLGMGFPAFRGGPFRWVDATGVKKVWDRLQYRQKLNGVRFKPAAMLGDHVKSGKPFYPK